MRRELAPRPRDGIAAVVVAGIAYALSVFALGFVLGAVRVLLVAPRLGDAAAVLAEAPIILAFSWLVSRWCCRRMEIRPDMRERALMGAVAFAVLMLAELGVSVWVFHRPLADQLAQYRSTPGITGLLAQVIFAAFPYLQTCRSIADSGNR